MGFIFVTGLLIAIYPLISQAYYHVEASRQIESFNEAVAEMSPEEIEKRFKLAETFNKTLDPSKIADPYGEEAKEAIAAYSHMLEVEEKIGYVDIPRINEKIPVYAGTRESILQRGAGHLEGTSLPIGGTGTHTVITAHRGLPNALMFRKLDDLQEGDVFYIHSLDRTLAYRVDQKKVVEPSNFSDVLVVENEDYATLLTCHPYMINSHRLLVRGHRIPYTAPIQEDVIETEQTVNRIPIYLIIAMLIDIILIIIVFYYRHRIRMLTMKEKENRNAKRLEKENHRA